MKMRITILVATVFLLLPALLRARDYNANTGRFITMDTFEGDKQNPETLHKYAYVHDNPVNLTDPSGYLAEEPLLVASFQTQMRSAPAATTVNAGRSAITKVLQAAALSAFLADSAGLFDHNPQTDIDTLERNNPDSMVFIHATSTGAWPELVGGGLPVIDSSKGLGKDFGRGFYTFNASSADPRILPAALQWANRTASEEGGVPEVTFWLIKRAQYNSLSKADFSALTTLQYSQVVGAFRDKITETTGKQVAFGEIAKPQGGTWVRDFSLPFQYKFEGLSGVQGLKFFGGFSPQPLH